MKRLSSHTLPSTKAAAVADWRSAATPAALALRAAVYRQIREFFNARGVLEAETPILSMAGNSDPNIASFELQFDGPAAAGEPRRWLRTSPEFPLKRLLAGGFGDCYELGKVFRNGEFGRRHNPEFSMLEWYRVGWTHMRLLDECVELVTSLFAARGIDMRFRKTSYRDLYRDFAGIDPFDASDLDLGIAVGKRTEIATEGLSRDDFLDLLMTHAIEPQLPAGQLTAVFDFPASQCALARIRRGDPPLAERFELYAGGMELANGYHELNDAREQRRRFESDLDRRKRRGQIQPALDERLLSALPALPDCAGVAMGIDRLLMALQGTPVLADTVAFDFSRA